MISGGVQSHGFQASALLQAYSALPLNVTSGITSMQGTAGRPLVAGASTVPLDVRAVTFIPRNAAVGSDFFALNARVTRVVRIGRIGLEAGIEAFNLTNRTNVVTRNGSFGTGDYPASPSATFRQPTGVGEPRSVQLMTRLRF